MKREKIEDDNSLTLSQILYAKRFDLILDRNLCTGCVICTLACPREAITLKPVPKDSEGIAQPPIVDIDEEKCDYHAICAVTCPFGALKIRINGEETNPAVEKEAYPLLVRDIEIDNERCDPECTICQEKCPLDVITVHFEPLSPEEIEERKQKGLPDTTEKTIVDVKTELCAACRVCEAECPAHVIRVTKFFDGSIDINQELCPEECQDCYDVCPVDALYLGEEGKVYANDMFCIYCGACLNVCPRPEALELCRTGIRHTAIKSGAWNKALERLTSTEGMNREFKAKRASKAIDAVKKLRSPKREET